MRRLWLAVFVVIAAIAGGLAVQGARQEAEYRRLIAAGEAALGEGRTYAAIEAFSGALAFKPESMLAHLRRGEAYHRQGSMEAAVRDLVQANRLEPGAPQPLERLGDLYTERAEFARAADWYSQAADRDASSASLAYRAGYARYRAGQVGHAIQPLRRAAAQAPAAAQMHHALGLALRDSGDPAGARVSLDKAVALAPTLLAAREALADLLGAVGEHTEQLRQLEALAALDPNVSRHIAVALAAADLGRTDRAVLALGSANDLSPNDPRLHLALGRIWLMDAERKGDRGSLRKAAEALSDPAAPPTSELLALQGRLAFLTGSRGEANRLLDRAVRERPVWPDAFRFQADALRAAGRASEADAALAKFNALR